MRLSLRRNACAHDCGQQHDGSWHGATAAELDDPYAAGQFRLVRQEAEKSSVLPPLQSGTPNEWRDAQRELAG